MENEHQKPGPDMETLAEDARALSAAAPAHSPPRILVVEDDIAIRQFQTHVLIRSGYHVDVAEDGLAGWEALNARHFDLLIANQHMPGLSGLELAAKVHSARMWLPVILLEAPRPEPNPERDPSIQLAATLSKPFSPAQLEETVKEALAQHARQRPCAAGIN